MSEVAVTSLKNGKIHKMYYCNECWNIVKRRPFKEDPVDDQEGRDSTDK